MEPEELLIAADARSRELELAGPLEAAVDRLRAECARVFATLPEPPVYRRADDPARKRAEELLRDVLELYAHFLLLERQAAPPAQAAPLGAALKAHLSVLCFTAGGRLELAEEAWHEARSLERGALSARRLWVRSDEERPPVFDPATGVSRYDPRPEPHVRVKLACVQPSCQKVDEYAFSPRHSTHRFVCPVCKKPFVAYFGELQSVQVEERSGQLKHYRFRLEEVGGGLSRIEFDEASGADLALARGDLLAFLYTEDRDLRAVLNLSTSRLLWIHRSNCFVATVAFGEGAAELDAFRAYRDRVLLRRRAGRAFVRAYYRAGPALARRISARPWARAAVRAMLRQIHGRLVRSGYR